MCFQERLRIVFKFQILKVSFVVIEGHVLSNHQTALDYVIQFGPIRRLFLEMRQFYPIRKQYLDILNLSSEKTALLMSCLCKMKKQFLEMLELCPVSIKIVKRSDN